MPTKQEIEDSIVELEKRLDAARDALARYDAPECGVGDVLEVDGTVVRLIEAAPGYVTLLTNDYRAPDRGIMVKVENIYDLTARELCGILGGLSYTICDNSNSAPHRNTGE